MKGRPPRKVEVKSIDEAAHGSGANPTIQIARGCTRDGAEVAFAVESRAAGALRYALSIGARPICSVHDWQVVS